MQAEVASERQGREEAQRQVSELRAQQRLAEAYRHRIDAELAAVRAESERLRSTAGLREMQVWGDERRLPSLDPHYGDAGG